MIKALPADARGDVWYVYDGECPLCRTASHALRIRKAVGQLYLIDARAQADHPVMQEINARGIDIDKGSVVKYGGRFYHGSDAMVIMALLSSGHGWVNRLNAALFRSPMVSRICYPVIRAGRNMLLKLKGVGQIRNLGDATGMPIFQSIFGESWQRMPQVMQDHYAVRAGSKDVVVSEGSLDVERSWLARLLSPMLQFLGVLAPHSGKEVPVTVRFYSRPGTRHFYFDRVFRFAGQAPCRFLSHMEQIQGNEVVEFMRYGVGWRMHYSWDGTKALLEHRGYVWRIFGLLVPLPLTLLIGRGDA